MCSEQLGHLSHKETSKRWDISLGPVLKTVYLILIVLDIKKIHELFINNLLTYIRMEDSVWT